MKLQSFRDGIEFELKEPNVDGYMEIIEKLKGPKEMVFKLIAMNSLKRTFSDVTLEEVGRMELADMVEIIRPGIEGMDILKNMVTSKTLEE